MPFRSNHALICEFLKVRKKWWSAPIIVFLLFMSFSVVQSQGSVIVPFVYAIF